MHETISARAAPRVLRQFALARRSEQAREDLQELTAIGYSAGHEPASGEAGVLVHDPELAQSGGRWR